MGSGKYGEWIHIWNELTQSAGHQIGYANMIGNTPDLVTPMKVDGCSCTHQHVYGRTLYIPLEFWFNRNPGLALPLIALNTAGHKSIESNGCGEMEMGKIHNQLQAPMLVACC
jgi:hypothetical protein